MRWTGASVDAAFPLSYAQQRLWWVQQLDRDSVAYHVAKAVRLPSGIDGDVLEACLAEIVRRHESLRTTFSIVDGRPVQRVHATARFALRRVDLSGLPEEEREECARQFASEEGRVPTSLERGPLFRATLFRLGRGDAILSLMLHHIVSDGWSWGVLFRELGALYGAFSRGLPSPLPELPIQYVDFALWQRDWLEGERSAAQAAYWRRQLDGVAMVQLPVDRPRPECQTFRGARLTVPLSEDLSREVRAFGRREGATPFMTLVAAFACLLSRYTGQDDVVVGTPVANRTRVELEGLIGCFVNPLVVRVDLSGGPRFREIVRRARGAALGAFANQDIPFQHLVERLNLARRSTHNPLFQTMFILQNTPHRALEIAGGRASAFDLDAGSSRFDLTLSLSPEGDSFVGLWEYNTDLFERETIARMAGHFAALLEGALADPATPVDSLPLLSSDESRRIAGESSGPRRDYDFDTPLIRRFEQLAARMPDATALLFGEDQMTYGELDRLAGELARELRSRGVGRETRVAVALDRGPGLVVALLAVLKAGGVYVPLDPAYPKERLDYMLEDSSAAVLVTRGGVEPISRKRAFHRGSVGDNRPPASATAESHPHDLAYVVYTSGSTGRPKGVAVEHQQLLNRFAWMWEAYPFRSGEVCCQKTSISFVDSIWELLGPLLEGVPTLLVPDEDVKDPERFVRTLARHRVSRLWLVPSLLRLMLESVPDLAGRLPDLRLWVTSGEPLPPDLCWRFVAEVPDALLLNLYGTSEVFDATAWEARDDGTRRVSIGGSIANVESYVLDGRGRLVPRGVVGELCVGGMGLARGYLDRPDLTAERFVPNPYSDEPGARLYRTGDLARYLPDGTLEHLGRKDHQVKIRGVRVETAEVEAVLLAHPSVRRAAVVARSDERGDSYLAAYVVSDESLSGREVKQHARRTLPEAAVPARIVFLGELPLTPSGKVNRLALPDPGVVSAEEVARATDFRDDVERELAAIWRDVLGVGRVSPADDFFDLGGHSMLAVRLFARIERAFGRTLPLAALFEASTIPALANLLRSSCSESPRRSLVPIVDQGSRPPFYLVHGIGGDVLNYGRLARLLRADHPVYGLRARGLDGREPRQERVEEMAETYLGEILARQACGPYLLGGQSFGGVVAFEMARRLWETGREVGLLVLLDTYGPGYPTFLPLARRVAAHVKKGGELDLRGRMEYVRTRADAVRRRLARKVAWTFPKVLADAEGSFYLEVLRSYTPAPYAGRIALIRASEQPVGCLPDPHLGWDSVATGGVDVREVPGGHANILDEPYVRALADALREVLRSSAEC